MSATVQFLTNEKGRKTAVVLPIEDYEKLREDIDDLSVIAERRDEETIPHAEFKKGLKRNGLSH
jgi:PHD/YefM family antitoxin component YafN of YafNO toxin-antitoxin module